MYTREAAELRLRVHIVPPFGKLELKAIRPSTVQAWLRDEAIEGHPLWGSGLRAYQAHTVANSGWLEVREKRSVLARYSYSG